MKDEEEFLKRVAELSRALETLFTAFKPTPDAQIISVVTLHWAARAALYGYAATQEEFLRGAKVAWETAVEELRAATPIKG